MWCYAMTFCRAFSNPGKVDMHIEGRIRSSPGKKDREPPVFVKYTFVPVGRSKLRALNLDAQGLQQAAPALRWCRHRDGCLISRKKYLREYGRINYRWINSVAVDCEPATARRQGNVISAQATLTAGRFLVNGVRALVDVNVVSFLTKKTSVKCGGWGNTHQT